jgi:hypothetical protein
MCVDEPYCYSFAVDCPSGATQYCLQGPCSGTSQTHATIACGVCSGPGHDCEGGQAPGSCDHNGATDLNQSCDMDNPEDNPNFAYSVGFCASPGGTVDCNGSYVGGWCPNGG